MKKLISFGEVLVDQIEVVFGQPPANFAGGAPANVAVCYSKLGGDSIFVGGIATDDKAEFLLEELQNSGVDTSFVKVFAKSQTAVAKVTLDKENERSFKILRDGTADTLFNKEHFERRMFKNALFFHFCSNSLTEGTLFEATLCAVDLALKEDLIVCFDVNLRFDLWSDHSLIEKRVSAFFASCHIIKMSLDELYYLTRVAGKSHDEYIFECIALGVSLVLVTDGANIVKCTTPTITISVRPPKINAEDTTAAGDGFIGGFLWFLGQSIETEKDLQRFLLSPELIREALDFSAVCGAVTCSTKGAFAALPTKQDVAEFKRLVS